MTILSGEPVGGEGLLPGIISLGNGHHGKEKGNKFHVCDGVRGCRSECVCVLLLWVNGVCREGSVK